MQLIVRLIVVAKPAAGRRSSLSSFSSFSPLIAAAYRALTPLIILARGDVVIGNPHRAPFFQFELFELISSYRNQTNGSLSRAYLLLSEVDKRLPFERFEATEHPPPLLKYCPDQLSRAPGGAAALREHRSGARGPRGGPL